MAAAAYDIGEPCLGYVTDLRVERVERDAGWTRIDGLEALSMARG